MHKSVSQKPQKVGRVKRTNHNVLFVILVVLLCLGLASLPNYKTPFGQNVVRVRARVLETDNSNIQTFGIVRQGEQSLKVEILEGAYKGKRTDANNILLGKMETDKMFKEGDMAFVVLKTQGGNLISAEAYDHYRLGIELLLVVIFSVLLIAFAGWPGVRALLSFVFALLLMWKVLLPGILSGQDPVLLALAVVTVMTAATLFLVAGVNRTAYVALIGSLLGILLTIGISFLLLPSFRLHGAIQPFSETLLYTGHEDLNLTRVFLAAIFIGASGAVLDVAIDVSTAMNEVAEKRPDLSKFELLKSGFVVGRNMTSTMVTTLLMAYTSGYMALLMVFMVQGVPPVNFLNTNYVAAEILKTVVGSFGLVTVAPFTAVVGSLIYSAVPARHIGYSHPATFSINADHCNVIVGHRVQPETLIGEDADSREPVYAGCHGIVKSMMLGNTHDVTRALQGDHGPPTLTITVQPTHKIEHAVAAPSGQQVPG